MSWLERIFRRRHLYGELGEEVRAHLEEKTEQLMRLENLPRAEARQAALRAFGNPTLLEERSREVWQWPRLESVLADVKFAFRRLRKSPGFAVTVLLTLAIGIGANTAVFSVVSCVLLKPLPYPDGDQLVSLSLNAPGAEGLASFQKGLPLSPSMYFTFSENNRTFQSLGTWSAQKANVTGLARPEEVNIVLVTTGVLEALGVPPFAGRELTAVIRSPAAQRASCSVMDTGSGVSAATVPSSAALSSSIPSRARLSVSCPAVSASSTTTSISWCRTRSIAIGKHWAVLDCRESGALNPE